MSPKGKCCKPGAANPKQAVKEQKIIKQKTSKRKIISPLSNDGDTQGTGQHEHKHEHEQAKVDPSGAPTVSAHPARFSPDDKFSRHRVTIKKRFGILPTQQPKPVW